MNYLLYILASVLFLLPFIDNRFSLFAWICLIPIIIAVDQEKDIRLLIRNSFFAGWSIFLGGMYWLTRVTWPGYFVLTFCLAWFIVLFALIRFYHKDFLVVPLAWTVVEFIRGNFCGGMPWLLLGTSQACCLPVIQIADLTGVYGVSFIVALVNIGIRELLLAGKIRHFAVVVVILGITLIYGGYRLNQPLSGQKMRVGIVQPNVPQNIKWDPDYSQWSLTRLKDLSRKLPPCDLIIWPETAVEYFEILKEIPELARERNCYFLVGSTSVSWEGTERIYYNSAFLISPTGRVINEYRKLHLVPFGEYIPLAKAFPFLKNLTPIEEGFAPGKEYTLFRLENGTNPVSFAALICFEDIFPELARVFVVQGAQFLVNLTNDAWFGDTVAPYQHADISVFRAIENGVSLVRAANTGFSCFIDSRGRIVDSVKDKSGREICTAGCLAREILVTKRDTFYTRYGNIFVWLSILGLVMLPAGRIFCASRTKRKNGGN